MGGSVGGGGGSGRSWKVEEEEAALGLLKKGGEWNRVRMTPIVTYGSGLDGTRPKFI